MSFTTQDIKVLRQVVREEVLDITEPRFRDLEQKFDGMQTAVDGYVKTMHVFDQEHFILKKQVDRVKTVLVGKNVASESDSAV